MPFGGWLGGLARRTGQARPKGATPRRPGTRSRVRPGARWGVGGPGRWLVWIGLFALLAVLAPTAQEAASTAAWWFFGWPVGPRVQAAPAEAPVAPAPPPRAIAAAWADTELETRLRAAVPGDNGTVSFWIKNVSTGATASLDADRPHAAASLIKVPVLIEALSQVERGTLRLDEELTILPEHWADGAGVLQAQVGTRHTVEQLLTLMTGVSDNIATLVLLDRIGRESVNALAQRLALPTLRLHTNTPATDPLDPDEPNRASARDMGLLLEALAGGQLLGPERTAQALRLMEQPQPSDWLGPGIPSSVPLAHKTGELPGVRHDCGLVFAGNGPYVFCVLTSDLMDQDDAGRTISTLARLAFQQLQRR